MRRRIIGAVAHVDLTLENGFIGERLPKMLFTQIAEGVGQELHKPHGPHRGNNIGLKIALGANDREDHRRGNVKGGGRGEHRTIDGTLSPLLQDSAAKISDGNRQKGQ